MTGYDSDAFRSAYDGLLAKWPGDREALTVPTPRGETRVNTCGPRDAPPLLLLPGGGGATSVSWYAQAADFARTHRVHAPDIVGAPGLSTPAPGRHPRTLAGLTGWLDALLDGLGIGSADMGGHSYGAWIALSYTLHAPARVRRLFLLDPTGCFAGYRPSYLLHALPMLLRPTPGRVRAFLEWETGGAAARTPEWLRLQEAGAGFPATKPVTRPRPAPRALRALATPVLLLAAGAGKVHDPGRVVAGAEALLPRVTTAVLPGVSHHALPQAAPEELTSRLASFLSG
ncbi:alpha/beta fold hydrolase [Streptomyces malaysiense]|uniref:Alpha/beta hydrolase n=1 Tax=Streptomyces malaysiense TaxID=1428626 RepID=A0A1J4Q8W3_9ACTN|nr:alpha/beta hydrolase [Streptomyces malaysiense]OIK29409.1 alpha/beta hydrolase [Streptomyces malaysiense]